MGETGLSTLDMIWLRQGGVKIPGTAVAHKRRNREYIAELAAATGIKDPAGFASS